MSVPVPTHFRFVFMGSYVGTPEVWSFSLKMNRNAPLAPDTDIGNISKSAVKSAFVALLSTSRFSSWVKGTAFKISVIGSDGLLQGTPYVEDVSGGGGPLGTGGLRYPTDQALCVTSVGSSRGPGRFGRFYLPTPALALGADGRLSTTDAGLLLADAVTFTKAVSDSNPAVGPAEMALLNVSSLPPGVGSTQTVKRLRVGRVLDRVERRRRSMLEDYQESGDIDW